MEQGGTHSKATRAKIAEAQKRRAEGVAELIRLAKKRGFEQINGKWYTPEEVLKMRKALGYDKDGLAMFP